MREDASLFSLVTKASLAVCDDDRKASEVTGKLTDWVFPATQTLLPESKETALPWSWSLPPSRVEKTSAEPTAFNLVTNAFWAPLSVFWKAPDVVQKSVE